MYAYILGRCPISGAQTVERKIMTAPNWSLYQDNVIYRRNNADRHKTIAASVNHAQDA